MPLEHERLAFAQIRRENAPVYFEGLTKNIYFCTKLPHVRGTSVPRVGQVRAEWVWLCDACSHGSLEGVRDVITSELWH